MSYCLENIFRIQKLFLSKYINYYYTYKKEPIEMGEISNIIEELHKIITKDQLKMDIEELFEVCRPLYETYDPSTRLYSTRHGGWEHIVLSSALIELARQLKDCRVLFSLKGVPLNDMPEEKEEIVVKYLKVPSEEIRKQRATEIDSLIVRGNQWCLLEHETKRSNLPRAIMSATINAYYMEKVGKSTSCVFITHSHVHRYEGDQNPISQLIGYAEACERLFDKNRWSIINIWESTYNWGLDRLDVWWIPQDFSITYLREKETESNNRRFWKELGKI